MEQSLSSAPAHECLTVGLGLFAQRLHHRRDGRAAHGVGPQHHPVRQQFGELVRQQADEVRMQVRREAGQEPDSGAGARRLHMDEDVGGAQAVPHGGHQPPRGVQIVHLQHGIDEVDQRMGGQFLDGFGGAVLSKIIAGGVHAEHVFAEPGGRGPVHLRFAHHHLDVQPGTLLERAPGHGDDLDAEPGVVAAQPGHRGGRDVGAEAVRGGHPDDAGDRVRGPAGLFEAPDRRLHPLGHLDRLGAQVRELPAAGRAGQHPPAQRLFQRGNPAGHGGVVQPKGLRRRRELRGAGDRQEHEQVIGVCIHICNSAHKGCWFDH